MKLIEKLKDLVKDMQQDMKACIRVTSEKSLSSVIKDKFSGQALATKMWISAINKIISKYEEEMRRSSKLIESIQGEPVSINCTDYYKKKKRRILRELTLLSEPIYNENDCGELIEEYCKKVEELKQLHKDYDTILKNGWEGLPCFFRGLCECI